jgi:hypothetical protein
MHFVDLGLGVTRRLRIFVVCFVFGEKESREPS